MKTTISSTFNKIWDPIRTKWVLASPEEKIRQRLIHQMIGELGFPRALIAVEKELASLPHRHLPPEMDPHRRLDLLCFAPGKEGLQPLLLAECKAVEIDKTAERQALGYNAAVGAAFLCLTNGVQTKTLWSEGEKIASVLFLPSYSQLLGKICLQ